MIIARLLSMKLSVKIGMMKREVEPISVAIASTAGRMIPTMNLNQGFDLFR